MVTWPRSIHASTSVLRCETKGLELLCHDFESENNIGAQIQVKCAELSLTLRIAYRKYREPRHGMPLKLRNSSRHSARYIVFHQYLFVELHSAPRLVQVPFYLFLAVLTEQLFQVILGLLCGPRRRAP